MDTERYLAEKTAIIFIGIQASGKSTFYRERLSGLVHISLDELNTRNKERLLLTECIENGRSFVIDNTDPEPADRQRYIEPARAAGYRIVGCYFSSSISECIARNALREGKARIPEKGIAATHKKLVLPSYDEGFDELYFVKTADDGFICERWEQNEL